MVNYTDRTVHIKIIKEVLEELFTSNAGSDLILKGGTALLQAVGVRCVPYEYNPNFKGRRVSICTNICEEDTSIVPFGDLEIHASAHRQDALCIIINDYHHDFYTMVLIDYIIGNTDRHSLNWGILLDNASNTIRGLHPIFDLNNAFNFVDKNAPSILKSRTSMKLFAIEALEEIGSYEMLDDIINYLSQKKVVKRHLDLLGTKDAINNMIKRCEELSN